MAMKFFAIAAAVLFASSAFARTTGTYRVPSGAYMDRDVLLKAPKVNVTENGDGTLELDYKLPKELDGAKPRNIKLESVSADNPSQLAGPDGVAVCEPISREFSCTISYFKQSNGLFQINTAAAAAYMAQRQFSPARIGLMEKAQQSIMHEAAGILFIKQR